MKPVNKEQYKIPVITQAQKRKRKLIDFLIFIIPLLILFIFLKVVFLIGFIPSASMFPLMNTDSGIIANKFAYFKSVPKRGDVIVFKKADSYMTKRIIGVPEDIVSIQNGMIYINEQPIIEDYVSTEVKTEPMIGINYYVVPENNYFVLGDNRESSNDSRNWEKPFVPIENITAKVLCVFSINPFSHGFYLRDVRGIDMDETYAGVPAYDPNNIVTEITKASTEHLSKEELNPDSSVPSTLPVKSIAPESVTEPEATESETETDESLTEDNTESMEGMVDIENESETSE
jgi:signal peptidase I